MNRTRGLAPIAAFGLAAGIVLLTSPVKATETTSEFPHDIHVGMDLECTYCHFADGAWDAAKPGPQICSECHDVEDLPPVFDTVSAHAAEKPWSFSHEWHVGEVGLECSACHETGADSGYQPKQASMAECLDCHREYGAEVTCTQCHEAYAADKVPGPGASLLLDHSVSWMTRHGEISRISQDTCALCHQVPDDCQSCHLDTPPRSHTRLFKLQTHGLEAEVDRDNCTTCHVQQDFCQSCHQDVEPLSHRAGWGNPGNQHCMQCHEPLADTPCATCHDSVQAHFETPPSDHVASWGDPVNLHCNSCHLPLVDTTCFTCHKDTASHEMPPGSHVAGFGQPANNHCQQCHVPLADTPDCSVCHDATPSHETEAPLNTHTAAWGPPTSLHCQSCHLPLSDNPDCTVCHDTADHSNAPPPPTHNGAWGEPTNNHCQSCHLPLADTDCAVCHQDTPSHREEPQTHRGGWAFPPVYEHCNTCHFPVTAEPDCYACHRQPAEHDTAPDMPFGHDPGSDCLYCHPSVRPIKHQVVDDNCVRCHELP